MKKYYVIKDYRGDYWDGEKFRGPIFAKTFEHYPKFYEFGGNHIITDINKALDKYGDNYYEVTEIWKRN